MATCPSCGAAKLTEQPCPRCGHGGTAVPPPETPGQREQGELRERLIAMRDTMRRDNEAHGWHRADLDTLAEAVNLLSDTNHLRERAERAEKEAAQWEGSFMGMVAVEKELKAQLARVREWAENYRDETGGKHVARSIASLLNTEESK